MLYNLKRYADCAIFCGLCITYYSQDKAKILLYQAKSLYYDYNRELIEQTERRTSMPGLEFKDMMVTFCKSRILQVIKTLTENSVQKVSDTVMDSINEYDSEAAYMLDKALLDYLVYNTKEVSICLLCHSKTRKLIHSHYIPKAILVEFVKAMGLDPGESVFIFTPSSDHPSSWQFKSAAKITFSMLCKTCDGTTLSQDENLFKTKFFNKIYRKDSPGYHFQDLSVPYAEFLYKFAIGLMFRNIAPLYSSICAEIGDFLQLHLLMKACRETILKKPSRQVKPKIYMITLPSQLPNTLPQISGWDKFVVMTNSPYGAYKLLQPGEPMLPKSLYCFMVKIGMMVFIVSLDVELDTELDRLCPFYEIQSSTEGNVPPSFVMKIPEDQRRAKYIPQKIWWSLLGWAKKEINTALSVALSVKPPPKLSGRFQAGLLVKDVLASKDTISQPVTANLLPPGFELNFDRHGTLPEKVITIPNGHAILLHSSFGSTSDAKGYAMIGKQESDSSSTGSAKKDKPALYSIISQPYVLVYLQDRGKKFILKAGFYVDSESFEVKDSLPGVPASMKNSPNLKELIEQVPDIIRDMLRTKGFRSLKSLLFWQESLKAFLNDDR